MKDESDFKKWEVFWDDDDDDDAWPFEIFVIYLTKFLASRAAELKLLSLDLFFSELFSCQEV